MSRILPSVLTSLLIIFSFTLFIPQTHAAVLSGWGTATIDGVINTTEWATASTLTYSAGSYSGTIYMMNDATNLYIGFIINGDDEIGINDGFMVTFDNDNGGEANLEVGDDYLWTNGVSQFFDYFWNGGVHLPDTTATGTTDGSGAASRVGSANHFELSHPLDSADDSYDFSLSTGQLVGFTILVSVDGFGWQLFGDLPLVPSGWENDYQVASDPGPLTPPNIPPSSVVVGGTMFPRNNLVILAPYITLIALVGLTIIVIKKRS